MLKELFHQHLDLLGRKWEEATDNIVLKEPKKNRKATTEEGKYERTRPAKGYTVVTQCQVKSYPCEWCDGFCSKEKTYSRSANSDLWRGKCEDCGTKRNFHTSQIIGAK